MRRRNSSIWFALFPSKVRARTALWSSLVLVCACVAGATICSAASLVYSSYAGEKPNIWVKACAVGPDGSLYIASDGTGIIKVDPSGSTTQLFARIGAFSEARIYDLVVSSQGNVYVAGWALGSGSITGMPSTAWQPDKADENDGFILVFTPAGSVAGGTYLGTPDNDECVAIDVDDAGHIFVATDTASSNFPVSAGAVGATNTYPTAVAITKFNTNASAMIFSARLPRHPSGPPDTSSMVVDSAGQAYVVGRPSPSIFPTTVNAYQRSGNEYDMFLSKLSADGSQLLYSTYIGALPVQEVAQCVEASDDGLAYVGGTSFGSGFPVTDTRLRIADKGAVVCVIDTALAGDLSLAYSTYIGSNRNDSVVSIARNSALLALVGVTTDSTLPLASPLQIGIDGQPSGAQGHRYGDAFLTVLSTVGYSPIFMSYFGGQYTEIATCTAVQGDRIYFAGGTSTSETDCPKLPITPFAFQVHRGVSCGFCACIAVGQTTAVAVTSASIRGMSSNNSAAILSCTMEGSRQGQRYGMGVSTNLLANTWIPSSSIWTGDMEASAMSISIPTNGSDHGMFFRIEEVE
jgi:hypothetical protein